MIEAAQDLLRGLSPAAQAAIIGGVAGGVVGGVFTLLGGALGLLGERWVRTWGKVRCKIEPIELWVFAGERTVTLHHLPIPPGVLPDQDPDPEAVRERTAWGEDEAVRYFVNAKLFNETEVKTGLRDVVIAFNTKPAIERTMRDRSTWRESQLFGSMDPLEVVDLPSSEWVTLSLIDSLSLEDARKLTECDRAWLRGYYPNNKRFSQRVPFAANRSEQA